ncbi:hypothetical protein D3Y57_08910 [Sphingomonas paeninsulae]|uniref:Uncharacterized protein n=1 Tax=Sphingomonas paeninsulae TaxID=2319844 RepID=A0A494TJV2_SPHPE|nr:hypothetical protein D3Y57_08910 [Sphingomonas paeninsulae]
MRWNDLTTTLIALLWSLLLVSGVEGLIGIRSRHIPGYPATAQIILYAGVPVLFLLFLVGAAILSRKARWFYDLYPFATGLVALFTFPV